MRAARVSMRNCVGSFFFFQAEDGIRVYKVTGVQTCALPICAPALLSAGGTRLAVLGASDHPAAFAATPDRPGIAYADLHDDPAGGWLADAVAAACRRADVGLVTPPRGPNMTVRPSAHIRAAAPALLSARAPPVARHSPHVVHGAARAVL